VTTVIQPDIEALVMTYLRSATGEIVDSGLPTGPTWVNHPTWPVITVSRGGGSGRYPGWINNPRLQIGAWADTKKTAHDAAAAALAALYDIPGVYEVEGAVVTHMTEDAGLQWLPDASITPARPRYIFFISLTLHPLPA
jgi:hypothetical protein